MNQVIIALWILLDWQSAYSQSNFSTRSPIALNFSDYSELHPVQQSRLQEFFEEKLSVYQFKSQTGFIPAVFQLSDSFDYANLFHKWLRANNGPAAAFLAITHALKQLHLIFPDGTSIKAINLLEKINSIEGDRIRVRLNSDLFLKWMNFGGFAFINDADTIFETGQFRFGGNQIGGSLHKGYDKQGFTSIRNNPRLQINYRFSDSEADIDLDGYSSFIWGMIPNPNHLTYENSDVRYWFPKYFKKFGSPGFEVISEKRNDLFQR